LLESSRQNPGRLILLAWEIFDMKRLLWHERRRGRLPEFLLAVLAVFGMAGATLAQDAPPVTLESVNAKADAAALAGHNAWMLTSCALVLFMTAPGLAMFYGGLVRKKNVLGVIMQCLTLMCLMTVIWGLYGYSLAFGEADGALKPFIGDGDYLFMKGVARSWPEGATAPVEPMAGAIPRLTHMLFQGMFFIITPALERFSN
jgi:Amt family ammonium transporter